MIDLLNISASVNGPAVPTRSQETQVDPSAPRNQYPRDDLRLGVADLPKTQKLLANQLVESLNQVFAGEGLPPVQDLYAEDFTPEAVANRVLGFVQNRLDGSASEDERGDLLAQARQGIENGLNSARETLQNLAPLSGEVEQNLLQTEQLLQRGLARLETGEPLFDDSAAATEVPASAAAPALGATPDAQPFAEAGLRPRIAQPLSVEAQREQGITARTFSRQLLEEGGAGLDISRYALSRVAFGVDGSLDSEQRVAVSELVSSVQSLADNFFDQNLDRILSAATRIDFNPVESDDATAANAVQSIQAESNPASEAIDNAGISRQSEPLNPLQSFIGETRELVQQAEEAGVQQANATIRDLLNQQIRQDSRFQQVDNPQALNLLLQRV